MSRQPVNDRMAMGGWLRAILLVILASFARWTLAADTGGALAAGAQAAAGGNGSMVSHAWVVTPSSARGETGAVIWHLPPRGGVLVEGWRPGTARLAGDVAQMPVAIGAVDNRLYMIFEDKPKVPPAKPREVLSLAAVAINGGEQWVTRPQGRYDASPALPSEGRVLSCIGSNGSLWTLMHGLRDVGDNPKQVYLLKMVEGKWSRIAIPEVLDQLSIKSTLTSGPGRVHMPLSWRLFAWSGGVGITVSDEGDAPGKGDQLLALWTLDAAALSWSPWEVRGPEGPMPPVPKLRFVETSHSLAAIFANAGGGTRVLVGGPSRRNAGTMILRDAATLALADDDLAIASLDGVGGVLLITREPGAAGDQLISGGRKMVEVSALTGRVMFDGALTLQSAITASDYRLIGLLWLLVVGTVIIFVAKPPGDSGEVHLPENTGLADPVRRVIASIIDLAIACVLGTVVWKVPVRSLFAAEWWSAPGSPAVAATIIIVLIIMGACCESFFGRTPGKLFTGCEVVRVARVKEGAKSPNEEDLHPPSLGASISRNIIKWLVPLVTALGLLDLSRRHRADQWAGTAVIERYEDYDEELGE